MKHIKQFESWYSVAASMLPEYTKPTNNTSFVVDRVLITYPDGTQLAFGVYEVLNSTTINYRLNILPESNRDGLHKLYLEYYGDVLQMEDYNEWIFVRCWTNPADFVENEWRGYIFKSKEDGPFYEVELKFHVLSSRIESNNNFYPTHFHNRYSISVYNLKSMLSVILSEMPNGLRYNELMKLKKKWESFLLTHSGKISLYGTPIEGEVHKIDGKSLISFIYALHLKDKPNGFDVFKKMNLRTIIEQRQIDSVVLLDLLFPE